MSGGQTLILPWGDGEYSFRINMGGWRRIQTVCEAGPEEIAARLSPVVEAMITGLQPSEAVALGKIGKWRYDDVREVIYQGLLGGGNAPPVTAKLMAEAVDGVPIREVIPLAYAIVLASLQGVPDDPLASAAEEAAPVQKTGPETQSSSSPKYTAAAAGRATRRRKSTK